MRTVLLLPYYSLAYLLSAHATDQPLVLADRALLLGAGAAVDAVDDDGCTPLYWACAEGCAGVVPLLLNAAVDDIADACDGEAAPASEGPAGAGSAVAAAAGAVLLLGFAAYLLAQRAIPTASSPDSASHP